ncbi:FliM/FliN family flagellar motor switch protein [Pseudomonas chlororaphis subsp. aurantiaca]|uniref:FliM/FliN family flagellar motor switch protein n=1 Tax=Pseudomonas chlororaphis TaxID=587753 RepID=UPI0027DDE236|nr:FliM/FliN family flagellar motor switch protein [Pseudomonas chlororaphis]WMI97626.1 FliM/FliN family flagellar motor switch protein [Pseudomonas chlororaphis subsp. aurantiaca]
MTGQNKVQHKVASEHLTFLKPEKLGRHYHRVPAYIKELTHKYPRVIADYFLIHYRIHCDLHEVHVQEQLKTSPECRYRTEIGKLGFSIDRPLLTELLESYYGGVSRADQDEPPVSSSETRMRARLGIDVSRMCARILRGGTPLENIDESVGTYEETHWGCRVELIFYSQATGVRSSIFLYLDAQVIDELTRHLAEDIPALLTEPPAHRVSQLPVRLDCVLARTQMPLTDVLGLKLDDILMVRLLDRCEVHIKQQKLFHGAISEDDGSLFLTSLDSVKNQ